MQGLVRDSLRLEGRKRRAASASSRSTSRSATVAASPRAMATTSSGSQKRALCRRKASRKSRLTRFRTTAEPTRFETVTPKRNIPTVLGQANQRKCGVMTFCPSPWTRKKSRRDSKRSCLRRRYEGDGLATLGWDIRQAKGRNQRRGTLLAVRKNAAPRSGRTRQEGNPRSLLLRHFHRQALAPLAAAVVQDLATSAGRHAGTEPMDTAATGVVGLVRALHGRSPSKFDGGLSGAAYRRAGQIFICPPMRTGPPRTQRRRGESWLVSRIPNPCQASRFKAGTSLRMRGILRGMDAGFCRARGVAIAGAAARPGNVPPAAAF